MSLARQKYWTDRLSESGWGVVWGKPVAIKRGRPVPGGVCIMARKHLLLQEVPMTKDEGPELYESGRVVHAAVATGSGKDTLHVFSFYGWPNAGKDPVARGKNEHLLRLLMAYIARLGNVPVLVHLINPTTTERSACIL